MLLTHLLISFHGRELVADCKAIRSPGRATWVSRTRVRDPCINMLSQLWPECGPVINLAQSPTLQNNMAPNPGTLLQVLESRRVRCFFVFTLRSATNSDPRKQVLVINCFNWLIDVLLKWHWRKRPIYNELVASGSQSILKRANSKTLTSQFYLSVDSSHCSSTFLSHLHNMELKLGNYINYQIKAAYK